jgi:hypothetical protein
MLHLTFVRVRGLGVSGDRTLWRVYFPKANNRSNDSPIKAIKSHSKINIPPGHCQIKSNKQSRSHRCTQDLPITWQTSLSFEFRPNGHSMNSDLIRLVAKCTSWLRALFCNIGWYIALGRAAVGCSARFGSVFCAWGIVVPRLNRSTRGVVLRRWDGARSGAALVFCFV